MANSFASFLLDWPNGVSRDLKVIDEPGTKHSAVFLFAQDKWQARPNITIDLGLRWEYYTPLTGVEGTGSLSNYDPATNVLRVAGYGTESESVGVKSTFSNLNARTGISWRLNSETVVRAGYGGSTIPFPDNRYAFNYPVKQNYSGSAANGFQNAGSMATGFPSPTLVNIPQDGIIAATGSLLNSTYDVIPPNLREGTLHSWNVAVQRQLPYHFTADIAYVGNRGVNLVMDIDENASLVYGSGNVGRPQFAQYNRTGTSRVRSNENKSEYNALQMKIDRRFMNGLLVMNSYTFSRSNDLVNENTTIGTPIDFDLSWARSNFDRTHNYVLTTIYELPWGPGKKWMGESLLGKIVGGWQLSGLFIAQSGTAIDDRRQRHAAQHARQQRVRRPQRLEHGARWPRTGPAVFRPVGILAAGGRRAGQHEAQQTAPKVQASGSSTCRSSSGSRSAAAASPSSASTRSTPPTRCAGATRARATASPPAIRSARSPARTVGSAACDSVGGSCSKQLSAISSQLSAEGNFAGPGAHLMRSASFFF